MWEYVTHRGGLIRNIRRPKKPLSFRIGIPWSGCEYKSYIPVTSEPESVAIACGLQLGGKDCEVFMQDSGYLNSLNNIKSLVEPYGFNIKIIVKPVKEPEHHKYSNELYEKIKRT